MPKAKASRTEQTPPVIRFFIADDVRLEQNNKVTVVGLYTDSVLILQMGEGKPEPSPEVPVGVASIAFLVSLSGLEGTKRISFKFDDSTQPQRPPEVREITFANPAQTANLVGRFQPLLVSSFGKKTLSLLIDDQTYPLQFEVRRGPDEVPQGFAGGLAPAVKRQVTASRKRIR